MAKRILITGATGFVGRHVLPSLVAYAYSIRAATRKPVILGEAIQVVPVGDITENIDWMRHIDGMDAVVHLAALAHVTSENSDADYDAINRRATVRLAKAAAAVGARFIFVSSIAAQTGPSAPNLLTEDDPPLPTTAYGRSKLRAEQEIATITNKYVVLRPTLTYGYGVKGNMGRIIKLAMLRLPPPFGSLHNRRSLLDVANMCEAINFVLHSEAVLKQVFILSDPEPVSMAQIISLLRRGARLSFGGLRVPPLLLATTLRLMGRHDLWMKIGENLITSVAKLERFGFRWKTNSTEALFGLGALYAGRDTNLIPHESAVNEARRLTL